MKALKNPVAAIFLAVILVASSTLLSASVNLGKDAQKVTDGFYDGVIYDGYKHPSIYSQLNNIIGAIDGMCAVAANNGVSTAALSMASSELKSSLSTMHDNISSIYLSYSAMCTQLIPFMNEINSISLSERESEGIEAYENTVTNAQRVIDESGYNESVRSYRSSLDAAANFFASLCGVTGPEYFA